jgi:hypothetical protein
MLVYNIGFINANNEHDETQLDVEEHNDEEVATIELINLILSLKDEMSIKEITYIEYVGYEEEEE